MVEWDSLENCNTCKGIRGSNPLASALNKIKLYLQKYQRFCAGSQSKAGRQKNCRYNFKKRILNDEAPAGA